MEHEGSIGVHFESDGYRLVGTLFLARGDAAKPTAVLLHGSPGIEKNADLAYALRDHGWNSLIFHYRGCWGSEGTYSFRTITDDVRAAFDELCSGFHPQVDADRLVLVGHSLGGWAAILAGAADQRAKAVAVYGAAADLGAIEITEDVAAREFTPWLRMTPHEFLEQRAEAARALRPLAVVDRIAPRPLLILHGGRDRWVPASQAEALVAHAGEPRRYIYYEDADHSFSWHRSQLREQLIEWLDELAL